MLEEPEVEEDLVDPGARAALEEPTVAKVDERGKQILAAAVNLLGRSTSGGAVDEAGVRETLERLNSFLSEAVPRLPHCPLLRPTIDACFKAAFQLRNSPATTPAEHPPAVVPSPAAKLMVAIPDGEARPAPGAAWSPAATRQPAVAGSIPQDVELAELRQQLVSKDEQLAQLESEVCHHPHAPVYLHTRPLH
jgi:hypothetical protein